MPVQLKTARVDLREVNNVAAAIRVISTPEFASEAMEIPQTGDRILAYLKRIFPKSPPSTERFGRRPLVEGWTKFDHPPKGFSVNKGFTIRRKNSDLRDHEIIASLDQGSKAYSRLISPGKVSSFIKTSPSLNPRGDIGEPVFFTGTGLLLKYKSRQGLHFMDRTYDYTQNLLNTASAKFKRAAKRKLENARA